MPISKRPGIAVREDPVIDPAEGSEMLYATSDHHREHSKEYWHYQKEHNTEIWKRRIQWSLDYYYRNQKQELIRRKQYAKENIKSENERKAKWGRESGNNKRDHVKRGEFRNKTYKESGYRHVMHYLNYRGMKPPLNFTMSYVNKTWAWIMPHP